MKWYLITVLMLSIFIVLIGHLNIFFGEMNNQILCLSYTCAYTHTYMYMCICMYIKRLLKSFAHFICACVCVCTHAYMCMLSHFIHVRLFATPWTVACQVPLSMEFSRQEYWSGLPCPPFSRGSSQPRDRTCIGSRVPYH